MKAKDSYWYSKLSVANTCARKYKYQFIDGIHPSGEHSADIEFGSAFHLGLEGYLDGDDGAQIFSIYWDSVKSNKMAYSRYGWDDLKTIGLRLLSNFESRHLKHLELQHGEQRLIGKIGPYSFEGTPDFIGLYKGVPTVLDFKTSARPYQPEKILYDDQLYGYAHLAQQCLGFEAAQIAYMVFCKQDNRIQTNCKLDLTKEKLSAMITNIEMQIKSIEERTVFPANGKSCMMGSYKCAYFDMCYGEKK